MHLQLASKHQTSLGLSKEVGQILKLLGKPHTRLGAGGSSETSLALEAESLLAGVYFVGVEDVNRQNTMLGLGEITGTLKVKVI